MTQARRGQPAEDVPAGRRRVRRATVSGMLARQLAGVPWDGLPRLYTIHVLDGRLLMRPVAVSRQAWEYRTPGDAIRQLAAGWAASPGGASPAGLLGAAVLFDDQSAYGLRAPVKGQRRRPRRPAAARAMIAIDLRCAPCGVIQSRDARQAQPIRVDPGWGVPSALSLLLAALLEDRCLVHGAAGPAR